MFYPISTMAIRSMRTSPAIATLMPERCGYLRSITTGGVASDASPSVGSTNENKDGQLITREPMCHGPLHSVTTSRSGFTETVHADYQPNLLNGVKVKLADKESTRRLRKTDTWVIDNLVGCLTKVRDIRFRFAVLRMHEWPRELRHVQAILMTRLPCLGYCLQEGKKATAQKIVLEAMEIIRSELAQSAASAAAETAARNAKVAEASEKAAVSGKRLRKEATGNAVSS